MKKPEMSEIKYFHMTPTHQHSPTPCIYVYDRNDTVKKKKLIQVSINALLAANLSKQWTFLHKKTIDISYPNFVNSSSFFDEIFMKASLMSEY